MLLLFTKAELEEAKTSLKDDTTAEGWSESGEVHNGEADLRLLENAKETTLTNAEGEQLWLVEALCPYTYHYLVGYVDKD